MNYSVEVQRNNLTLSAFLSAVKAACKTKGIDFNLSRDELEKPASEYMNSYSVIDGKKHCHDAYYQTTKNFRRKLASYTTSEGFTRYYHTDEIEEYEETKLVHKDSIWSAEDAPCKSETFRQFAYDYQCYVLNFDGSCYNEICEFTFDNDKTGHGYYYQANKDADN